MRVIGVDGCRGGWIAVTVTDRTVSFERLELQEISDVLNSSADAIGVDIPMGLPDVGVRACDVAARKRLGRRASTVFAAPARSVLDATDYAQARSILTDLGGPSMSAQAWGLVKAVRTVDAAVTPDRQQVVIETHPESSYTLMAGEPLPPKTTPQGISQRRQLIGDWLSDIDVDTDIPSGLPIVDSLDALACAWSAQRFARGQADILGDDQLDARGLRMRIAV